MGTTPKQRREPHPDASVAVLTDLKHVIIIRWDDALQRPRMELGGTNPYLAYQMLGALLEELYEQLEKPDIQP